MENMDLFDKIEDYLKNRLNEADKNAFEAEMANNPALAEEVALHRDMMETTPSKDVLDLRKLMESAHQESLKEKDRPDVERPRKGCGMWVFGLAVLMLGVAALFWVTMGKSIDPDLPPAVPQADSVRIPIAQTPEQEDSTQISNPSPTVKTLSTAEYAALARKIYAEKPYSPGVLMSEEEEEQVESPLTRAAEAFKRKQFSEVLKILTPLPENGRSDALKLRAHAAFQLKRYDTAAADFEELTKRISYRSDAEWHLLLCHAARLPKTKASYEMLLAKVAAPGHPFHKQAQSLQKQVSQLEKPEPRNGSPIVN